MDLSSTNFPSSDHGMSAYWRTKFLRLSMVKASSLVFPVHEGMFGMWTYTDSRGWGAKKGKSGVKALASV